MSWFVRDPAGFAGEPLTGVLSLTYRDAALAPSGWVLSLADTNPAVPTLMQRGAGIIHTGAPYGNLTGTVNPGPNGESRYARVSTGGADVITFHGHTDRSLLWHRVALPASAGDMTWSDSGAAHTVLTDLFDDQFGSSGIDPTRHNSVYDTASGTPTTSIDIDLPRYSVIGERLAPQLADEDLFLRTYAENDKILFELVEADDTGQILTIGNGALLRRQVDVSGIAASRVYVLGGGQGAARTIREINDTDSDIWSLMETAIDQRQLGVGDTAALDAAGRQALALGSIGRTVEVAPDADVELGDKVKVELDPGVLEDRYIVAQTITINPKEESRTFDLGLTLDSDEIPGSVTALTGGRQDTSVDETAGDTELVTITSGNWANRGGAYQPLTVARQGNVVILSGVLSPTSPSAFEVIGTLPSRFRPPGRVSTAAMASGTVAERFDVAADGNISCSCSITRLHLGVSMAWVV